MLFDMVYNTYVTKKPGCCFFPEVWCLSVYTHSLPQWSCQTTESYASQWLFSKAKNWRTYETGETGVEGIKYQKVAKYRYNLYLQFDTMTVSGCFIACVIVCSVFVKISNLTSESFVALANWTSCVSLSCFSEVFGFR